MRATVFVRTLLTGFVLAAAITPALAAPPARKVAVLLANHGSHSPSWRAALLDVEQATRDAILKGGVVSAVRTAFMEYSEPSIATQMKTFDQEGYTDVIVVPLFLSVSRHTFDDLPTILGRKADPQSIQTLKLERIARYTPTARTVITQPIDYSQLLKQNVLRRVKKLSTNPAQEGVVLIAYGDHTYEKQWEALMTDVGRHIVEATGMKTHTHAWCGHVANYESAPTTAAITSVLESTRRAVVIPILVARDEMFQVKIVGGGVAAVPDYKTRVAYVPDSILPDPDINAWVIKVVQGEALKLAAGNAR